MIDIPDNIFPSDAQCPRCHKPLDGCTCPAYDPTQPKLDQFKPRLRLEKSGRKGKAVTVIDGLPPDEAYLKNLAKVLKSKTGSGGTFYVAESGGVIEVQGDKANIIRPILNQQGIALGNVKNNLKETRYKKQDTNKMQ